MRSCYFIKQSMMLCLIFSFLFFTSCKENKNNGVANYDIFLCIGQSNMAGRASLDSTDYDTISNVFLLNSENKIEKASNPLNKYSTIRKEIGMQKMGLSYSFAKEIQQRTNRPILLVVNAKGGSSINSWIKGADDGFFEDAIKRAKEASVYGTIKAILWHQGEADRKYPESYKQKITQFIFDLRTDLGNLKLPFILGEIAHWNWTSEEEGTTPFNAMLKTLPDEINNVSCVSAEGLTPMLDESDPHFSRDSQIKLGLRYAEKVIDICY